MTATLLAVAGALLLWPGRWGRVRPAAPSPHDAVLRALAAPPAIPLLVGAVGALVSTPIVAALAGAAAWGGVRFVRARRAAARIDAGVRGLADGLGALASDLRSGRSLDEAVTAAGSACASAETGRWLVQAVRAPDVPPPELPDELRHVMVRIAGATRLSARTGCSLAAVAAALEDDLRARVRHGAELRAATAGPRASAAVLAGLPVLGLLMGSGVGADPWTVLTTTGTGQVLLVVGAALEAAGLAWSHRLVQRALTVPIGSP